MINNEFIYEIFQSIQGEGSLVGIPFVFVRFCGCNLRCDYCDTKKSWKERKYCDIYYNNKKTKLLNPLDYEKVLEIISNFDCKYISFTGGEPLLKYNFIKLIIENLNNNIFLIETNGTLYQNLDSFLLEKVDYWSVDWKLKSSINLDIIDYNKKFLEKLIDSRGKIIVKVIFDNNIMEDEVNELFNFISNIYKNKKELELIFQPITKNNKISLCKDKLDYLLNKIKNKDYIIRIIPQLHKIIKIK